MKKMILKGAAIRALSTFTGRSAVAQYRAFSNLAVSCWRSTIALSVLTLALCPSAAMAGDSMQIFVRNLNPFLGQRVMTIDVDGSDSIEYVTQELQKRLGYLPQDQFLFYGPTLLVGSRTLADYNIQKESLLNLALIESFDGLASAGVAGGLTANTNPFMMRGGTSGPGVGWSVFNYADAIDLAASSEGAHTLRLYTVEPSYGMEGEMANFDGQRSYDWTFVTASGGITGFSPEQFSIDTRNFANPHSGTFSVVQRGDSLAISYQALPVPEPETYALMLAGLALVGTAARRRRARA